ncbi:MAG: transposase [Bifidobacteriaceae bacterium]|nr:transposase [Bifidobacteriaceae bacterium]
MSVNRHGRYSDQFRAEAAATVIELGKPQCEVCRELRVSKSALSKWVAEARGTPPAKPVRPAADAAELEREVARLRQENSFLGYPEVFITQGIRTAGLWRPGRVSAGGGLAWSA